jgi:hypothetical protein
MYAMTTVVSFSVGCMCLSLAPRMWVYPRRPAGRSHPMDFAPHEYVRGDVSVCHCSTCAARFER